MAERSWLHIFSSTVLILLLNQCFVEVCAAAESPQVAQREHGTGNLQSPDVEAPKVFNFSGEARANDVIGIQGANFDPTTSVYLERPEQHRVPLKIVDRVTTMWMALRVPDPLPEPLFLRVVNQHGESAVLRINAALPQMLDTTEIVPGGRFRVMGRGLLRPGHRPVVTVGGLYATVDTAASDENMLVVTAPSDIVEGSAEIRCDNGNGTGATALTGSVRVTMGSGDPLELGVGWAAGFTFTDHRLPSEAHCDGTSDDTQTIEDAVSRVAAQGGGIVELPAGTCRISGTVNLASKVVLRGAGRDKTILRYESNTPLYAENMDLVGIEGFTLLNAGRVEEGIVWKNNTRSFIRDMALSMLVSRQWFLTGNENLVFDRNSILQTGSYDLQNPYRFDGSSGLVFTNNHSTNVNGSPTFQRVHDALFLNNRFSRDASSQFEDPIVAHHGFVFDFSWRVAILGNTFDVANGPVTNVDRNDGETVLIEGGGGFRTENIGIVQSATATTVSEPGNGANANPFGAGLPIDSGLAIVSGEGTGQTRRVVAYDGRTLTIDHPWDVVPEPGSHFASFVWGLEDALIKGNTLLDNPRGIWLYQSSVRNVAILGNTVRNGGGIFLRSYQNIDQHIFTVQSGIVIADNDLRNDTGQWMSYIILSAVRANASPFGIGQIGIEVRRNRVGANTPNVTSVKEDYAAHEGFAALVHVESQDKGPSDIPMILGTIFQQNRCDNCERALWTGPGGAGTVIVENTSDPMPDLFTDVPSSPEGSDKAEPPSR